MLKIINYELSDLRFNYTNIYGLHKLVYYYVNNIIYFDKIRYLYPTLYKYTTTRPQY